MCSPRRQFPSSAKFPATTNATSQSIVSLWRFDPDARKLRVTLNPAQSRPFALLVRSQTAAGTLPFEQELGLLSVENSAGQIGLLGIATGNEVQLDSAPSPLTPLPSDRRGGPAQSLSPINLEDFPAEPAAALQ